MNISTIFHKSLGRRDGRASGRRRGGEATRRRPSLESLEGRLVLSMAAAAPPIPTPPAHVAPQPQATTAVSLPMSLTGINLTNITRDATTGVVTAVGTATGTLLGQTFTTPLTATITPGATATSVPILDLQLNAIHLDLLGLKVDTSNICLDITATPGPGNLLGNLLGGTGGLLNILNTATTDLNGALSGLTTLLNTATTTAGGTLLGGLSGLLGGATSQASVPTGGAAHSAAATTNILHLSLGPVDLNLLGLGVHLDNCANGPVTVDVSAQRGPGNLLGNLLSDVAHLLDRPNTGLTLAQQVNSLLGIIEGI
jgi:hypothetical protein